MKIPKSITLWALILTIICPAVLSAQKYVQVWGDEFNVPGLPDSTKWDYERGFVRNNELQFYTKERLENARIEDSVLIIEARKESYQGASYTSASLISRGVGDWRYGKVEVSVKVPVGKGTWPAVWMMPTYSEYGGWPRSGEIDIMEYVGFEPHKLFHTVHYEGTGGSGHESSGTSYTFTQPYNQFIKFTLVWTPEKIEWYANDVWKHTFFKNSDDSRRWPFNKEFYLILNLAYGGSWGAQQGIDDTKLPHKFLIDYVRVYQLQETEGPFSLTIEESIGGMVEIDPVMDIYTEGTEVTLTAIPDEGYAFGAWRHFSRANPFTFTVNKDTRIIPEFVNERELIINGAFDISSSPWEFYVNNAQTAAYQAIVVDSVFTVNVTKSPGVDWQLGFQQLGFAVRQGEYKLMFDAWADQQKQLLVTVSKNYPDWSELTGKRQVITTSRESYEMLLNVPRDDDNVRLYFGLGNFLGKFNIDNISLTRTDDVTSASERPIAWEQAGFSVFPNPAEKTFTLVISEKYLKDKPMAEIYTLEGRKIMERKLWDVQTDFDGSKLLPGVYLVRIRAAGVSNVTRLVIGGK
jgi:beta-glucanase (GH16 family)